MMNPNMPPNMHLPPNVSGQLNPIINQNPNPQQMNSSVMQNLPPQNHNPSMNSSVLPQHNQGNHNPIHMPPNMNPNLWNSQHLQNIQPPDDPMGWKKTGNVNPHPQSTIPPIHSSQPIPISEVFIFSFE